MPTLIQEPGPEARPIEDKRAELAALPAELRLSEAEAAEIRAVGDNSGCMALKGASPEHTGEERPDGWALSDELVAAGRRWDIDPERDLRQEEQAQGSVSAAKARPRPANVDAGASGALPIWFQADAVVSTRHKASSPSAQDRRHSH